MTYRIQETKPLAEQQEQETCFFSLLVGLLEQVERVDSSGRLHKVTQNYFNKCIKAYLIEVETLRAKD